MRSKHFVCNGMGMMDNITMFKDHTGFKYIHGSRFPRQSKDKIYVFKMLIDLLRSGVDLVKCMHVERHMKN